LKSASGWGNELQRMVSRTSESFVWANSRI
jgi:hypothetical protein